MLALALGDTVGSLQQRMTRREFLEWADFYQLYPFDDYHRHHRPAALAAVAGTGMKAEDALEWLQPDPQTRGLSAVDRAMLKAFGGKG